MKKEAEKIEKKVREDRSLDDITVSDEMEKELFNKIQLLFSFHFPMIIFSVFSFSLPYSLQFVCPVFLDIFSNKGNMMLSG